MTIGKIAGIIAAIGVLIGPVCFAQANTSEPPRSLPLTPALTTDLGTNALALQFSDFGNFLQIAAPADGGKLLQMPVSGGKPQAVLTGFGEVAVGSVALSPDGHRAASLALDASGLTYYVQVWDTVTAKRVFALPDVDNADWQKSGLLGLNFSGDGTRLLTLQRGGHTEIWDVSQQKRLAQIELQGGHVFENALLSPDARHIAYVGEDRVLRLCDVASGETRELDNHVACHRLAFSPDGTLLAVATNEGIDLWGMPTGKKLRTLRGQTGFLFTLAFRRDGAQLASGTIQTGTKRPDWRGSVFVWNVENGQPAATIDGFPESVMSLALSPDGALLAAGSNFESVVRIWKLTP